MFSWVAALCCCVAVGVGHQANFAFKRLAFCEENIVSFLRISEDVAVTDVAIDVDRHLARFDFFGKATMRETILLPRSSTSVASARTNNSLAHQKIIGRWGQFSIKGEWCDPIVNPRLKFESRTLAEVFHPDFRRHRSVFEFQERSAMEDVSPRLPFAHFVRVPQLNQQGQEGAGSSQRRDPSCEVHPTSVSSHISLGTQVGFFALLISVGMAWGLAFTCIGIRWLDWMLNNASFPVMAASFVAYGVFGFAIGAAIIDTVFYLGRQFGIAG